MYQYIEDTESGRGTHTYISKLWCVRSFANTSFHSVNVGYGRYKEFTISLILLCVGVTNGILVKTLLNDDIINNENNDDGDSDN